MVDLEKLVVHIKSVEEGQAVVDWFVEQGFHTDGLRPVNYTAYPYFIADDAFGKKLLWGSRDRPFYDRRLTIMEYEEWTGFVEEYSGKNNFEIEDDAFFEVLGLS